MTSIFISHAKEDAPCAEQLRQELEMKSYTIWREPAVLTAQSPSYKRTIERGILGSTLVIFVWSSSAAQSQPVILHLSLAQSLQKPFLFVTLDATLLPDTLKPVSSIQSSAPCTGLVSQLLPQLPVPDSTQPLIALSEQAASDIIRTRRMAVQMAGQMLGRGEQREEVLAVLNYLAHNDDITNVRNDALAVIGANAKKTLPWSDDTQYIFGVTCKNNHTSYFDRRIVCNDSRVVVRGLHNQPGGKSELYLICKVCQSEVVDRTQDCRDCQ